MFLNITIGCDSHSMRTDFLCKFKSSADMVHTWIRQNGLNMQNVLLQNQLQINSYSITES